MNRRGNIKTILEAVDRFMNDNSTKPRKPNP